MKKSNVLLSCVILLLFASSIGVQAENYVKFEKDWIQFMYLSGCDVKETILPEGKQVHISAPGEAEFNLIAYQKKPDFKKKLQELKDKFEKEYKKQGAKELQIKEKGGQVEGWIMSYKLKGKKFKNDTFCDIRDNVPLCITIEYQVKDKWGYPPQMVNNILESLMMKGRDIFVAIDLKDLEAVKKLVAGDSSCMKVTKDIGACRGCTPLHAAAARGNIEIFDFLLEKIGNVDIKDKIGATPLHYVVMYDIDESRKKIIETLLARGANLNIKDKYGETPLDMARKMGQEKAADFLVKKGAKSGKSL